MQKVLEIAIGLVLVFAVFSVLVSSITEALSAMLHLRHANLVEGIARMLGEKDGSGPFTATLLSHPLIQATTKGKSSPSYLDAVTFTVALLDVQGLSARALAVIAPDKSTLEALVAIDTQGQAGAGLQGMAEEVKIQLRELWKESKGDPIAFVVRLADQRDQPGGADKLRVVIGPQADVDARITAFAQRATTRGDTNLATFVRQKWEQDGAASTEPLGLPVPVGERDVPRFVDALVTPRLSSLAAATADEVTAGLQQLGGPLGTSLLALWNRVDQKFDAFSDEVEDWFDRQMQRTSGWYAKRVQWIMFVAGLCLAFGLNVSATTVAQGLWANDAVRATTNQLAAEAVSSTTVSPTTSGAPTTGPTTTAPTATVPTYEQLEDAGLPVGWNARAWPGANVVNLLLHLIGIALVALAGSFGAPIWFDLLGKLVNMRIAGPKPDPATVTRSGSGV